jgi:site-specific DNA-methyltransferase (adenine-specific)
MTRKYGTGDNYETPDYLFDPINDIFKFTLDVCASFENSKCKFYFSENYSALSNNWNIDLKNPTAVWMNPPYSRGNIDKFMKKAYEQSLNNCTVVCLVRDDPTTAWYKTYVNNKASYILRLKKRIKFKGGKSCYSFPCCLVIYDNNTKQNNSIYKLWWVDEPIN